MFQKIVFFLICPLFCFLLPLAECADELFLLPQADQQGIVLSSKVLHIQGAKYPFNASIVWNKDKTGYLLFFRIDRPGVTLGCHNGSRIGVVPLNATFDQTKKPVFPHYPVFGRTIEDPRVFWIGSSLYTLYYVHPRPKPLCPCLLKINSETFRPITAHLFSRKKTPEKNWVPIIPVTKTSSLFFLRTIYPQSIVQFNRETRTSKILSGKNSKMESPPHWKWGYLSGGTPAIRVGSIYLSFFHSWFLSSFDQRIYVLGACTFDSKYPFRMRSISRYPILFKDLYTARAQGMVGEFFSRKWARHVEKVIFPGGFVQERLSCGRYLIHLACGENDNSIRIITFDRDELLKSLVPIPR